MARARAIKVVESPKAANDQARAPRELLTVQLTPELRAGLLALRPLFALVDAEERGQHVRPPRPKAPLPPRPEMTAADRAAIASDLSRKGFKT